MTGDEQARSGRVGVIGSYMARSLSLLMRVITIPLALASAAVAGVAAVWCLRSAELSSSFNTVFPANGQAMVGFLASYGGVASGGAILLAAIKDLVSSLPSITEFVKSWSLRAILVPSGTVFVAAFGLTLALSSLPNSNEDEKRSPVVLSVLPHQTPGGGHSLASFYVAFPEANEESVTNGAGLGVDVPPEYEELIRSIVLGLRKCGEQSTDGRPVMRIVGLASSSEFKNSSPEGSRTLNRQLANLRATKIAEEIERSNDSGTISVEVHRWRSYEEMVRARQFGDRGVEGEYDEEMGLLNRRAEIQILNAADCELRTPALL